MLCGSPLDGRRSGRESGQAEESEVGTRSTSIRTSPPPPAPVPCAGSRAGALEEREVDSPVAAPREVLDAKRDERDEERERRP